jgi:hypothetical protein
MNILNNKRVLLFAPNAFGYEYEIKYKMESMGACVDYFDERPANAFWTKMFIRINRILLSRKIERYYNCISQQVRNKNYDYIIFVNSESVSKQILMRLKIEHPHAKSILYLWDSLRNKKNAILIYKYFDKVLSFDPDDVKKYGFIFRPLFYIDSYQKFGITKNFIYDALFIGTMHSDRYDFIKKIEEQLLRNNRKVYCYFFLHNVIFYYINILTKKSYQKTL